MNSDNLVGITLGNRYDMLEKIGTGGMATVYKAKDTLLNRYVAIKILRDSLEGEEQVVSNFIKEAQSSASLVHNNIVSVYDVGEENGLNYMVMEYVDGIPIGDADQLVANGYDLEEIGSKMLDNYATQILDHGFFHADPHPGNVIIRDGRIVYIDLGNMGCL